MFGSQGNKALESSDCFEVEKIMASRCMDNGIEYLVKWKDCAESENQWILAKDMNCFELIREFEEQKKLEPKPLNSNKKDKKKRKRSKDGKDIAFKHSSKRQKKEKLPSTYSFELRLINDPELHKVQERNLALLAESSEVLSKFDFWRTLDEYNFSVRRPQRPGTRQFFIQRERIIKNTIGDEYFFKELGPLVAMKVFFAENCHGCDSLIDEGEYCFWHPREPGFVDMHYCQLCVAYITYHLQVLKEIPDTPIDVKLALEHVLVAKYPKFYANRFPAVDPSNLV